MIKTVWINTNGLQGYHPESLKYHLTGEYEQLEDTNDEYYSGKANLWSKCNLLLVSNPYGIKGIKTINWFTTIREDLASKIAKPCKHCFNLTSQ